MSQNTSLKSAVSEETVLLFLCKNQGWTYDEYYSQPDWFISGLMQMYNIDAQSQSRQQSN